MLALMLFLSVYVAIRWRDRSVRDRALIWLMVGAMALATGAALALVPLGADAAGDVPARASARELLRDPAFLATIAAASLVQASHAVYYGFSTLDWQATGYDGGVIGALWALGVMSEIALFALSARLPAATPSRSTMWTAIWPRRSYRCCTAR